MATKVAPFGEVKQKGASVLLNPSNSRGGAENFGCSAKNSARFKSPGGPDMIQDSSTSGETPRLAEGSQLGTVI